jgi:glycosyltransferase involved in cell wall biosynthesis
MKILHVLNTVRDLGNGINHVAVDLACLQAKAGHTVVVASIGGEFEGLLALHGVTHRHLDQRLRPDSIAKAAYEYRAMISTFEPDIVHAHMIAGTVLAWLLRFRHGYRLVATVHNEFRLDAVLMGLADRVIAVSDAVADALRRRGIPSAKLRVVKNGPLGSPRNVPVGELEPKPLLRPAITTVAGMYYRKGIGELLDAFDAVSSKHPKAHLYIVGDGPNRSAFERRAVASPARERIHFEGFQKQPQRYMVSSDIFVLASRRDPFPLVIAEAREARCAIVATAVDGIPEAVDGGSAGILVPAQDVPALSAAITTLLDDPGLLSRWREKSAANLRWLRADRLLNETMDVYRGTRDPALRAACTL